MIELLQSFHFGIKLFFIMEETEVPYEAFPIVVVMPPNASNYRFPKTLFFHWIAIPFAPEFH